MATPPPVILPELTRPERSDPGRLRRRTTLIGLGVAALVLVAVVALGLRSAAPQGRPVVLAAPEFSRLAVDGEPQPVLGRDGTHMLRLSPGSHDLAVTLRSGVVVEHQLQVEDGADSLMLELRWDKVYRRWRVIEEGSPP